MRRRVTLAILGTVLVTLLLVGVGILLLGRIAARPATEKDLRAQAQATAGLLEVPRRATTSDTTPAPRTVTRERLNQIRESLKVEDMDVVVLDAGNRVLAAGDQLPPGVTIADIDPDALRAGEVVSGSVGNRVFAAAALPPTPNDLVGVLVLTRPVDPLFGRSVRWFLLASGLTLAIAAVIAAALSERLTRPLRDATAATARIAEGDLSVRLPEHPDRARHDELDALGHSINSMAVALERSRGLERQFLLSVSHDLRTPLTNIEGYAEAIADDATPDARAAALTILSESRRLERLVNDLLDLAKLESRQFSLSLAPTDLGALAGASVEGFRREVTEAGLEIDLIPAGSLVVVQADPDRLSQVLANLIENALKYAHRRIEVEVMADPAGPRVEVTDDGPGIAPEDLPHVFERLYRVSATPARKETGSGLGLAIVRELVDAMGGTVEATPNPTGGTRMVVRLRPAPGPPAPPSDAGPTTGAVAS